MTISVRDLLVKGSALGGVDKGLISDLEAGNLSQALQDAITGGGGGGGTTNLTISRTGNTLTIHSSSGADVVVPIASVSAAGILTSALFNQFNAAVNMEQVRDALAGASLDGTDGYIRAGSGIGIVGDDVGNTLTLSATGGGAARDQIIDFDLASGRNRLRIEGDDQTYSGDASLTQQFSPETIRGTEVIVHGSPGSAMRLIVSIQGSSAADIDGLEFIIMNATAFTIDQFAVATGPGVGRSFGSGVVTPIGPFHRALVKVSASADVSASNGVLVTTEPLIAADITGVTAGAGLTGGGNTGAVSLAVERPVPAGGSDGQVLSVNASGVLEWVDAQSGGGSSGGHSVLTYLRRCAIRNERGDFTAADFTDPATGSTSRTYLIHVPTWDSPDPPDPKVPLGTIRQLAFAIPTSVGDLTALYFAGSRLFNALAGFEKQDYVLEIGPVGEEVEYTLWVNPVVYYINSGIAVELLP